MSGFLGNSGVLFRGLNPAYFETYYYCSQELIVKTIFYEDVVPPLCSINRYNGHGPVDISVAKHLLCIKEAMEFNSVHRDIIKHALIHDFHEAYVGDITTDMKSVIGDNRVSNISQEFDKLIYSVIGIDPPSYMQKSVVRAYDLYMLYLERQAADGRMFREDIWGEFNMFADDDTEYMSDTVYNIIMKPYDVVLEELTQALLEYDIIEESPQHCLNLTSPRNSDLTFVAESQYRFPKQPTLFKQFYKGKYVKTLYVVCDGLERSALIEEVDRQCLNQ